MRDYTAEKLAHAKQAYDEVHQWARTCSEHRQNASTPEMRYLCGKAYDVAISRREELLERLKKLQGLIQS